MMKTKLLLLSWVICAIVVSQIPVHGQTEETPWNVKDAISMDLRLRWEHADQLGLEYSDALTARVRLGLDFPIMQRMTGFVEGEFTIAAGSDNYDPYPGDQGNPGKTIIADPENLELNRAFITYTENFVTVVVGRQRIIRNNARFIGNVGWRQNEQTFDSIYANIDVNESFQFVYGFMGQANRIFGREADVQTQRFFDMSSHLAELTYKGEGPVDAGIYTYLLQVKNAPSQSSDTFGIWLTGTHPVSDDFSVVWRAEMANQMDNSKSPDGESFDLKYYHLTAGFKKGRVGLGIGGEKLSGDGAKGFSTPLATLHAFNGFADAFLTTPVEGLQDLYIKASMDFMPSLTGALILHKFSSGGGGIKYGKEVDAVITYKLNDRISFTSKVAFYDGEKGAPFGTSTDLERFWLQADIKY